jgi:hypothetical protein
VFVAAQLLAALGLTASAHGLLRRSLAPLYAFAAAAIAVIPQLWSMWSRNADRIGIFLDPWPYVPAAFVRAGLGRTEFLRLVGAAYEGHWSLLAASAFGGGLVLYLLFTFGARSAGLLAFARSVWPISGRALPFLLSVIVVSGPVASLLLDIGPKGYPRRQLYNDAVWFFLVSKHVSWLFAVGAVLKLRAPRARALAVTALVALSVPSTVQMLAVRFAEPMPRLAPQEVAMLDFLRAEVRPGQVCMATQDVAQMILVAVPCRTLVLDVYPHSFPSPQEQARLRELRDGFWREWRGEDGGGRAVRWASLSELGADYLIVMRRRDGGAPVLREPGDPAAPSLEPCFENALFTVFRVRRAPSV